MTRAGVLRTVASDLNALVEAGAVTTLVRKGWTLAEHARHPGDPVPELLRMTCGGSL